MGVKAIGGGNTVRSPAQCSVSEPPELGQPESYVPCDVV